MNEWLDIHYIWHIGIIQKSIYYSWNKTLKHAEKLNGTTNSVDEWNREWTIRNSGIWGNKEKLEDSSEFSFSHELRNQSKETESIKKHTWRILSE